MSPQAEPTESPAGSGAAGRQKLDPAEFSLRLQTASRTLWLIAAAVLGRRTDAEDVLQEAAVIGLQKLSDFDPSTNFSAWMGGIVRNVARNQARKTSRRQTTAADPRAIDQSRPANPAAPGGPSFDSRGRLVADQADFDDRVLHALGGLEEVARACLLLRTLKEMPYREISLLLGIPEGTAMSHVHRARQSLRQHLAADPGR
jgi:RNA polymerase sigma-70 factor (ECF subfamily)